MGSSWPKRSAGHNGGTGRFGPGPAWGPGRADCGKWIKIPALPEGAAKVGDRRIKGVELEQQTELEGEVAQLIAEAVNLEKPIAELDPDTPLFGEGLGLDSIDVLEIALAVSRKYGFQLRSDDPQNLSIFASLRSLSAHIAQHRTR